MSGLLARRTGGFSVAEVVLVTAVLGLAALLLVPVFRADRGMLRERALNAMCQVRLRNLGVATMLYASDYDGSLPWVDTAGGVTGGAAHTSWATYTLHRDYLGDAPGLTAAQWGDGQDAARNAYILGQARPAPFVCPVSIVHYTNAAPGNPFGEPIHYTYTPGINTANYWVGFNPEPWIDLTVEMCQRAEARYGGRWMLWGDRVQPEAIYTNWEITRVATHHRRADDSPAGGHAVWLDGAVSWRTFPDEWTPEQVWRPRDALRLFADHPGNGVASLGAPPPWGRASLPIEGFLHPDPAARRTARQKLRGLF